MSTDFYFQKLLSVIFWKKKINIIYYYNLVGHSVIRISHWSHLLYLYILLKTIRLYWSKCWLPHHQFYSEPTIIATRKISFTWCLPQTLLVSVHKISLNFFLLKNWLLMVTNITLNLSVCGAIIFITTSSKLILCLKCYHLLLHVSLNLPKDFTKKAAIQVYLK